MRFHSLNKLPINFTFGTTATVNGVCAFDNDGVCLRYDWLRYPILYTVLAMKIFLDK